MARKVGITVEDVVDAAAEIADAEGVEAVSMKAVAKRLGIRSPSLYAHVRGLDDLKRLLALRAAGAMAAALGEAAEGREGAEALRAIARAYRRFALERPGLYDAAQHAVAAGEDDELYQALAEVVAPALRALGQVGVEGEERVHLTRAIRSALHGFVALERAGGFGMPASVDASFERLVGLLLSGVGEGV